MKEKNVRNFSDTTYLLRNGVVELFGYNLACQIVKKVYNHVKSSQRMHALGWRRERFMQKT